MKIVDATGLVSIKIVGAIGLDGKLWAQQVWSAVGVRVGVAHWALEWAWHIGVRVGVALCLWALEWAWHS